MDIAFARNVRFYLYGPIRHAFPCIFTLLGRTRASYRDEIIGDNAPNEIHRHLDESFIAGDISLSLFCEENEETPFRRLSLLPFPAESVARSSLRKKGRNTESEGVHARESRRSLIAYVRELIYSTLARTCR